MVSTLDLSSVTDRLIELLDGAVTASPMWTTNGGSVTPFTIDVNGLMPEAVRNRGTCQLSVYLFHLNAEAYTRNMPIGGNRPQTNPRQPLGLNLYYLVTAYAKDQSAQEQQAMSIAVKALHERATYVDPGNGFTFTITLENEKQDEANRRWQSFSTSFRLSMVYRVSVTFLTPQSLPPAPAAPPRRLGIAAGPVALPFARGGALAATASRIDFEPFPATPGATITYDYSPAIAVPGGSFAVFGNELDQPTTQRLYLIDAAGVEHDVTPWRAPAPQNTASRVVVRLPNAIGALPGNSPEPGMYTLRVGSAIVSGDTVDFRSNAIPLSVAPRVTAVPAPWNPVAGVFTFTGAGFVDGATEVLIDTVALTAIAPGGAPAAGEFALNAVAGTSISFRPPTSLGAGSYTIRVRVRGIEGPPVGGITLP